MRHDASLELVKIVGVTGLSAVLGYVGNWVSWLLFGRLQLLIGVPFPYAAVMSPPYQYQIAWTVVGIILSWLIVLPGRGIASRSRQYRKTTETKFQPKETIRTFSPEDAERFFVGEENRRKTHQTSEDEFERNASKILQSLGSFVAACNGELRVLAKKPENNERIEQIEEIVKKRDTAVTTLRKLENLLKEWREKSYRSYVT